MKDFPEISKFRITMPRILKKKSPSIYEIKVNILCFIFNSFPKCFNKKSTTHTSYFLFSRTFPGSHGQRTRTRQRFARATRCAAGRSTNPSPDKSKASWRTRKFLIEKAEADCYLKYQLKHVFPQFDLTFCNNFLETVANVRKIRSASARARICPSVRTSTSATASTRLPCNNPGKWAPHCLLQTLVNCTLFNKTTPFF